MSAAYPFFGTSDELPNFDTALKWARGYNYHDTTFVYDTLTLEMAHEVQSDQYLIGELQNPSFMPIINLQYRTPKDVFVDVFAKIEHQQSHSSPIYYLPVGTIFHSLPNSWSPYAKLYTLRFCNVIIAFFLAFFLLKTLALFYADIRIIAAAGLLFAAIPQSIYYFINIDILSALTSVVTFYFALLLIQQQKLKWAVLLGLLAAIAVLVKASALVASFCAFLMVLLAFLSFNRKKWITILASVIAFCVGLVPTLMMRKMAGVGYFATRYKLEILTWTEKEWSDYLPHVLFTKSGVSVFFNKTWSSWWLGENLWNGGPMYSDKVGTVFAAITLVFLVVFLVNTIQKRKERSLLQLLRYITWLTISGYFVLFAYLSIKHDFGICVYPSSFFPVFVSGRLMLGMLFPFVFLLVDSLHFLLRKSQNVLIFSVLAWLALLLFELYFTHEVFFDQKNFFHAILLK